MLLKTATHIAARHKQRIKLPRPKLFYRCIESDESSRPFPSPYPTRPALIGKPENEREQEEKQHLLPVPMLTATDNVTNTANTEQLFNNENNNDTLKQRQQQERQYQQRRQAHPLVDAVSFQPQHHFDTYKLLLALERQGFSRTQAEVVMKGIKFKLRERYI